MSAREKPMLFSGPMVRAILDGRKTQTRRVVKPKPAPPAVIYDWPTSDTVVIPKLYDERSGRKWVRWQYSMTKCGDTHCDMTQSVRGPLDPYGIEGTRIWVRETWAPFEHNPGCVYRADADEDGSVPYLDNGSGGSGGGVCSYTPTKWKPSIFMPKKFSRIWLEITEVRVERLQDISQDDARAEGVERQGGGYVDYMVASRSSNQPTARTSFESLWESINGKGSLDENPWVWVYTFKRVKGGEA